LGAGPNLLKVAKVSNTLKPLKQYKQKQQQNYKVMGPSPFFEKRVLKVSILLMCLDFKKVKVLETLKSFKKWPWAKAYFL